MSKNTLKDKIWEMHKVAELPGGQTQLFIGRHLVHEVTSPQAFEVLRENGLKVKHPELTFAVMDHVVPTDCLDRPYKDGQAELMAKTLEENVKEHGIRYFAPNSGKGGVCHVVFPEKGIIWPGVTAVCGDSHTCTYGAFGALAFGIGTTQVGHVLATQTLAMEDMKVRRINFNGKMPRGVTAKDLALYMIVDLGVKGGLGFAYEFGGKAVEREIGMEGRMTLCNMAVEGGARLGYVNPDGLTFKTLFGKEFSPSNVGGAETFWKTVASDKDAEYDSVRNFNVEEFSPVVSWGTNPEQSIAIGGIIPDPKSFNEKTKAELEDSLKYMGLVPGQKIEGTPIDVAFIGSCTNGRFADLYAAAEILKGRKVAVRTLVVPGSEHVKQAAEKYGLDKIFLDAGAEWRYAGCSMCLAMNPDKLVGNQRCASTSNRNFKGRQGSPTGRTHLMSPYTAAASAIEGRIADPRKYLSGGEK